MDFAFLDCSDADIPGVYNALPSQFLHGGNIIQNVPTHTSFAMVW